MRSPPYMGDNSISTPTEQVATPLSGKHKNFVNNLLAFCIPKRETRNPKPETLNPQVETLAHEVLGLVASLD